MNISKRIMDGTFCPAELRYCFHSGAAHQQRAQATSDLGKQGKLTDTAQGTFSQFEGPVAQSPFYKALLTTGIQNTSNAYQNARSNMRAKAAAAGFGYAQPVTQGADNQMDAAEASDLARVPNEAMIAAAPLSMKAGEDTAGMGMGYGQQGSGMLGANAAQTMGLYNSLLNTGINAGTGIATSYCPAKGSLYLMSDGSEKPVETLQVGDELAGIDGEPQTIVEIQTMRDDVLRVETEDGFVTRNSRAHAFALPVGGFVEAIDALGKKIRSSKGASKVVSIEWDGVEEVFSVITDGSHTYRADGVWALGVGKAERRQRLELAS